jgi:GNAT superfamily N-acetyltransferase
MMKRRSEGHLALQASGERLALRPFRRENMAAAEAWRGQTKAFVDVSSEGAWGRGVRHAIVLHGRDEPVGSVDSRAGYPTAGWLTISRIVVAPHLQAHGYAAEAVVLLEEEAQRRSLAHHFLAGVGLNRGLDLYFWLRLGYRPARPGDVPWLGRPPRDIIAMVRVDTTAAQSSK